MLVTKLKPGDILQVGDAQLLVGKITGSTVRLSIHAPAHIEIQRLQPLQSGEVDLLGAVVLPDVGAPPSIATPLVAGVSPAAPAPLRVRRTRS